MVGSKRYNTGDDQDLLAFLTRLNERVSALETGNRAGFTAVDRGAFVVQEGNFRVLDEEGNTVVELGKGSGNDYGLRLIDDDGNVIARFDRAVDGRHAITFFDNEGNIKAELGQLGSNQYGIAVINGNELADLGNLVFGMRTATVTAGEATNQTSYTDLVTPGPEVTVNVGNTGKVEVTLSAWMQVDVGFSGNTVGGGMMAFRVDDGATRAENDVEALYCRLNASLAGPVSLELGASRTIIVDGLSPGPHKFTARYKMVSGGNFVSFSNRHIIVKPL